MFLVFDVRLTFYLYCFVTRDIEGQGSTVSQPLSLYLILTLQI